MSKKYEVPDMDIKIEVDYHKTDAEYDCAPAPVLTFNFPVFVDGKFVGTESRSVLLTRTLTHQLIDDFNSIMRGKWEPKRPEAQDG